VEKINIYSSGPCQITMYISSRLCSETYIWGSKYVINRWAGLKLLSSLWLYRTLLGDFSSGDFTGDDFLSLLSILIYNLKITISWSKAFCFIGKVRKTIFWLLLFLFHEGGITLPFGGFWLPEVHSLKQEFTLDSWSDSLSQCDGGIYQRGS
jgi:hypothetical protein